MSQIAGHSDQIVVVPHEQDFVLFPWIKRSDLIVRPLDSGGWIVKDPLTLKYALLNDTEYGVLESMDGDATVNHLLRRVRQLCPERDVSREDLGTFTHLLAQHQLIRRRGPGSSAGPDATASRKHLLQWLGPALGILRIHLPLLNPSRWLDRLLPVVRRLVHPLVVWLCWLVVILAATLALTQFAQLQASLPTLEEFLGPQNLFLILTIFVSVKVLHEIGHALTARYFGAECNECGIMLMVFTPVLYTNVTDTWLLPRRQRLAVTAAGIAVELLIASVAILLWYCAAPGLTRSLLLNVILICSINTLLFNGNPLLRFDGYFLLTDWVRLPNLSTRADTAVRNQLLSLVTGQPAEQAEEPRTQRFLLTYGFFSTGYRLLLTVGILQLVRQLGRQWHLEFAATCLSAMLVFGFFGIPTMRFLRDLFFAATDASSERYHYVRMAVASAVVLGLLFVPLPCSVVSPGIVRPNGHAIYAELSGRISPVVRYGTQVQENARLAELDDSAVGLRQAQLTAHVAELTQRLEAITNSVVTADSEVIPTLRESLASAQQDLATFQRESAALTVRSPVSGIYLPPPRTPRETRSDLPQRWWGTPSQTDNEGAWVERGTLLGHVGDRKDLSVLACVAESEIERIQVGLSAEFLSRGSGPVCRGRISEVARLPAEQVDMQFHVAGLVSGRPDAQGLVPAVNSYLVTIQLEVSEADTAPALYSVGSVRIHVEHASIVARLTRYLRRTFS